jgi:tRNA(Ile)-lysidine synthase
LDSNQRPSGYEPDELPLLHPAATKGSIGTRRKGGQELIQPFTTTLRALVAAGDTVIVGVSGGADSLALLDLTARTAKSLGIRPVVGHLDHGWRAESADDAQFVAAEATRRGLGFVTERVTLADRSEAGARDARLRFFAGVAAELGASGVFVGHTADDQAETVLLHLLRGSGTRGLGAMRMSSQLRVDGSSLRLLRPLLRMRRAELHAYCLARRLEPRADTSNDDVRYARNRVRAELLPVAEAIAPGATLALARAAAILADDAEFVSVAAREAIGALASERAEARIVLRRRPLGSLPVALQRAVVREVGLELLGPVSELGLERIEAARAAILRGRGGALIQWPGSVDVRVERDEAIFERRR